MRNSAVVPWAPAIERHLQTLLTQVIPHSSEMYKYHLSPKQPMSRLIQSMSELNV